MAQPPEPFISVIIPVYNDAARLARCLAALEAQTWPRDRLEVVVIDNGSTDDLAALLERYPAVVRASEDRPGSYPGRNGGLQVAKGEILAFTDSDCLPEPGWLAAGASHLIADPEAGIVGGRVDLRVAKPGQPTAVELYELLWGFPQETYVTTERYS